MESERKIWELYQVVLNYMRYANRELEPHAIVPYLCKTNVITTREHMKLSMNLMLNKPTSKKWVRFYEKNIYVKGKVTYPHWWFFTNQKTTQLQMRLFITMLKFRAKKKNI